MNPSTPLVRVWGMAIYPSMQSISPVWTGNEILTASGGFDVRPTNYLVRSITAVNQERHHLSGIPEIL